MLAFLPLRDRGDSSPTSKRYRLSAGRSLAGWGLRVGDLSAQAQLRDLGPHLNGRSFELFAQDLHSSGRDPSQRSCFERVHFILSPQALLHSTGPGLHRFHPNPFTTGEGHSALHAQGSDVRPAGQAAGRYLRVGIRSMVQGVIDCRCYGSLSIAVGADHLFISSADDSAGSSASFFFLDAQGAAGSALAPVALVALVAFRACHTRLSRISFRPRGGLPTTRNENQQHDHDEGSTHSDKPFPVGNFSCPSASVLAPKSGV
jgi:hypothetical protein